MENTNSDNNNSLANRDHDGFFKYVYSSPKNARSLLELCSTNNTNLQQLLSDIDLSTLQQLPSTYNNVGERGEADVAFKAIIIYNGRVDWDPLANFKNRNRAKFQGHDLPFECVLVNLAKISDNDCLACDNPEAALGAIVMKYAFDADSLGKKLGLVETFLGKMPNSLRSLTLEKIKVYLGEYINKEVLMELEKEFISIGKRLGFVSAGDAHRAEIRQLKTDLAAKDAEIAANKEQIAALKAQLAALQK